MTAPAATTEGGGGAYKWLVLFLLTLAYAASMIDRQLPFILAQAIKADLKLSDTRLGLLGGLLFASFYTVFGIPLARLADIYPRKVVLSAAIAFWCGMTALGGLAANFLQLAGTRVGVAVGEAGCVPAAHSLIADSFRPERRATAISLFSAGNPIGAMLGLLLGGWIVEASNWRTALFMVGLPGLALAAVIMALVREPVRGAMDAAGVRDAGAGPESGAAPTLIGTFRLLWSRRSFRHMAMGCGLYAFGASAKIAFAPSFLMRAHGLTPAQTGAMLGLVVGISGVLGIVAGGLLGDRLGKLDKRWYMWLPAVSLLVAAPCLAVAFLTRSAALSLICLVPSYGLGILFTAPTFAMAQALAPPRARAMAAAVLMSAMFLIGNTFGPTIIGAISDALAPTAGRLSLSWALALTALTNLLGVLHFLRAARFLRGDLLAPK